MDGVRGADEAALGPCQECGRPLPDGTQRYCVHCGAEVDGTTAPPAASAPVARRPASWSSGDYRAPAPTDGHGLDLSSDPWDLGATTVPWPATPVPTSAPARLELTYPPDPVEEPTAPAPVQWAPEPPPAQPFAPPLPPQLPYAQPFPPVYAPVEPPVMPAPPPMPAPAMQAPPMQPPPAQPPPEMFLPMRQQPPAVQQVYGDLPAAYVQQPLPGSPAGVPGGWGPAPEPPRRSGMVVPLLVVAALVLVAVTGGALLWLRSQRAADVTATPISATTAPRTPSGASPSALSPASPAGGTASSAAGDVGPTTTAASSSGASGASSAPLSAADFVRTVDGLLDESSAARGTVASTAMALQSCRTSATHAAAVFSSAGAARSSLATRAGGVDGAAAPGGSDAVAAFVAMQQASARADGALADWAHDVSAAGCRSTAPHTANWALANQYSADATAAKAKFVAIWNPIAAANGLSPRGTDAI